MPPDLPPSSAVPLIPARARLIGIASVAVALGVQELVAGLITPVPSLMAGVAGWMIDEAPGSVVEWAIGFLRHRTKAVLVVGIAGVAFLLGVLMAGRSRAVRAAVFVAFGLAGGLATAQGPQAELVPSLLNGVVAATGGLVIDHGLRASPVSYDPSRRRFLARVAPVAALGAVAALGGRYLLERARLLVTHRDDVVLPPPVETVAPATEVHQFESLGLLPVVTPNPDFFKVDIAALNPPVIDLATWTLTISGMVDRELTLTYPDLLELALIERYTTLACVSNKVGGRLVGNAKWLGFPLAKLLEQAGVHPDADQVVATGADGFSSGFPLAAVYDRDTLLAIGMNDEPLPIDHGFPARTVVPGLYGFASATKWLTDIELTRWDDYDSYWVRRGWGKEAPIKTQSRIDSPRDRTAFAAGSRLIAGVAWAPTRGISRVEVMVDDGPWLEAELSEPLSDNAWVQWRLPWDAQPGEHTISVRATDGLGDTQTAEESSPLPDGATGHHTILVMAE